ncbi:MAG: glutamyl-tRNA reductase [Xanthomonadaceae bacterium]|nr:glutamyl-tRNA reductase [Xanthomonadaceae bacterium]
MSIFVLGINHKTAPVEIREQLAFNAVSIPAALAELRAHAGVDEAAIVSTCNRTEVWFAAGHDELPAVRSWLAARRALDNDAVDACLYAHTDDAAVRHLFRVACGLDSLVLGEPQILGQLKHAYRDAVEAGAAGPVLSRAFQHSFSVAKQVRTDTGIGASPVSVAFAVVSLARQIFANFNNHTALLIGAGDTIELTARHLRAQGIGRLLIANRSIERAAELAARFNGIAFALDELDQHLVQADMIVSATASPVPVLTRAQVGKALAQRRHRPVFIADVAVPRDVESAVGDFEDVYLYTVDDLSNVIDESLRSRREAADEAEQIIELSVAQFAGALRTLDAVDTIRDLRDRAGRTRDDAVDEAARLLASGERPEFVLHWLGHTLTNRLLHQPTVRMRDAGFEGDREALANARRLLGLEDDTGA